MGQLLKPEAKDIPVFHGHGNADQIVQFQFGKSTVDFLKENVGMGTFREEEGKAKGVRFEVGSCETISCVIDQALTLHDVAISYRSIRACHTRRALPRSSTSDSSWRKLCQHHRRLNALSRRGAHSSVQKLLMSGVLPCDPSRS